MGYSTGRFEGAALVIETTNFTAATLEPRWGVMHSEHLKLTERLEVNPTTHELTISWTIDDPLIFRQRLTQKEAYVRTERWRERYNCRPGYQQ
jgi:hypothetical protein